MCSYYGCLKKFDSTSKTQFIRNTVTRGSLYTYYMIYKQIRYGSGNLMLTMYHLSSDTTALSEMHSPQSTFRPASNCNLCKTYLGSYKLGYIICKDNKDNYFHLQNVQNITVQLARNQTAWQIFHHLPLFLVHLKCTLPSTASCLRYLSRLGEVSKITNEINVKTCREKSKCIFYRLKLFFCTIFTAGYCYLVVHTSRWVMPEQRHASKFHILKCCQVLIFCSMKAGKTKPNQKS